MLRTATLFAGFGGDGLVDVDEDVPGVGARTTGRGDEVRIERAASKVSAWRTLIAGPARSGEGCSVGLSAASGWRHSFGVGE